MVVDEMPAGSKLAILFAEKVLGWIPYVVPHYSTDIAAAWELVEKLRQLQFMIRLTMSSGQYDWPQEWGLIIWKSVYRDSGMTVGNYWEDCIPRGKCREVLFGAKASSAPLAICRAALKFAECMECKDEHRRDASGP